jgi:hypothetical protein
MLIKRSLQSKATVFDISGRVNVHVLAPLFARYKSPHVIHFKNRRRIATESVYPELPKHFGAMEERALLTTLCEFMNTNMIEPKNHIMIKIQRTYTYPQSEISIPNLFYHEIGSQVYHKGVLCVSRENIIGGMHQLYYKNEEFFSSELRQGDIMYFKDLDHSMVPIRPRSDKEEAYIDFVTLFELES